MHRQTSCTNSQIAAPRLRSRPSAAYPELKNGNADPAGACTSTVYSLELVSRRTTRALSRSSTAHGAILNETPAAPMHPFCTSYVCSDNKTEVEPCALDGGSGGSVHCTGFENTITLHLAAKSGGPAHALALVCRRLGLRAELTIQIQPQDGCVTQQPRSRRAWLGQCE